MSGGDGAKRVENVIIIGSGPAGYTAALYTARADLEPLVIEGFQWGGLLQQTTDVENYPGYPQGVTGPEMMAEFRASAIMLDRARDTDNIELLTPYVVERFEAGENGALGKAVLTNTEGGEDRELVLDGAFIAIGHRPNSQLVEGQLDVDDNGYLLVEGRSSRTKLAGVFAAGDLIDHTYRQAITAAGSGCAAALDAEAYLRDTPPNAEAHWTPDPDKVEAAAEAAAGS